jgi:outer membrane protein
MLNLTTLCDPERIKGNSLWVYWPALNNHNEEVDMKKLAAAALF